MKPIKVRPTIIDIPFIDADGNEVLRLQFDRSDQTANKFFDSIPEIEEQIRTIEQDPNADFDECSLMGKLVDSVLGGGAFGKLRALNESTFMAAKYFLQIVIGIKEEMENEDKQAVFDKYK